MASASFLFCDPWCCTGLSTPSSACMVSPSWMLSPGQHAISWPTAMSPFMSSHVCVCVFGLAGPIWLQDSEHVAWYGQFLSTLSCFSISPAMCSHVSLWLGRTHLPWGQSACCMVMSSQVLLTVVQNHVFLLARSLHSSAGLPAICFINAMIGLIVSASSGNIFFIFVWERLSAPVSLSQLDMSITCVMP